MISEETTDIWIVCIFLDGVTENENKDLSPTQKKSEDAKSCGGSLQNYTTSAIS